ncbi:hypothetical protein AJ80_05044 [Polytolypa hystricis UAMH7299]|uniref:Ell binding protein Ebp1 C-terminal domain-containing protein n=1 Tax=Polytolypa hystricis (strain UAMH7299) TaxID=1447883 RepID=A0A2B7Y6R9_POLH7|nr:hypothetical protein AJ80_05044 [Polytolypa hystricis UAMH7299]
MSADRNPAAPNPPKKRSFSEYLTGINSRFQHLTDNVLPASPYLLTLPTERPFRLGSRFVSNWAVGENRFFAPDEEHLQYMTFLSHQDEEDTLLVAVGGWCDQNGSVMDEDSTRSAAVTEPTTTTTTTTTTSTPRNGVQKKKISLSDYKKKAKEAPKSPSVSNDSDKASRLPQMDRVSSSKSSFLADSRPKKNGERRRPAAESRGYEDKNDATVTEKAVKKTAPNSKPQQQDSLIFSEKPDSSSATKRAGTPLVPALLSPTLPPASSSPRLPKLLSPTLPPDIEEDLARLFDAPPSSKGISTPKNTSSPRPPPDIKESATRPHSSSNSSSSSKTTTSKPAPTELSTTSRSHQSSGSKHLPQPEPSSRSEPPPPNTSPSSAPAGKSSRTRSRLIVKLRYGRANRKRVEALLKFSGKRRLASENVAVRPKAEPETNQTTRESHPPPRRAEKYPATASAPAPLRGKRPKGSDDVDEEEVPSKRQRSATVTTNNNAEKPRTPVIPAPKSSSSIQQPEASKPRFLTPNKDLKGVPMRRLGSGDSDVNTPTALVSSTPGRTEKVSRPLTSPAASGDVHLNKSRDTERRAWRDEFRKYVNLGRELKHASQRHTAARRPSEASSTTDVKLGAAIGVEAVLCFILAFITEDKSKALARQVGESSGWRSILAYWHAVKHMTAPYPHLRGLCVLLGAISHDTIHRIDLERLAVTPFPNELSPSETSGNDVANNNNNNIDELRRQQKDFTELKARLLESHKEARRLWIEGLQELPEDVLAREYPVTWSKRSRNYSERGKHGEAEAMKLGQYSGEFFLPLGAATTAPLEAIRFGWSFLAEWTEKEGVNWKGRLGL